MVPTWGFGGYCTIGPIILWDCLWAVKHAKRKMVTLNCFNDKCLRNFTIGSVSYLQLTVWKKLHDPRSLVLLLRRSTSSCAWVWGIRPDTKCDHLRCCVCGPFLNVVHLVLYFNSSCSHAPNVTRSAKEPCLGYSVGFISLRWSEGHLSPASIELFRNVGRVPTKGIQRAPFHQCPVVQRVCI